MNHASKIDQRSTKFFQKTREQSEIGKNERERRSFAFSSVQFMNLAHISGELK